MTPNPSSFQHFSSAPALPVGVLSASFRATQSGREPQQPQTRGETLVTFEGAFSTNRRA
jgi:hypothetical protein